MCDLSSLTRIKPVPPTLEAQSLSHRTTREVPRQPVLFRAWEGAETPITGESTLGQFFFYFACLLCQGIYESAPG